MHGLVKNTSFFACRLRVALHSADHLSPNSTTHGLCKTCQSLIDGLGRTQLPFVARSVSSTSSASQDSVLLKTLNRTSDELMTFTSPSHTGAGFSPMYLHSLQGHDLKRYLQEVGTDPREGRYWLKHFQRSTDPFHPFAVVHVDHRIMRDKEELDSFASSLAFLHRSGMKLVVVHGQNAEDSSSDQEEIQNNRQQILIDNMLLVSVLESHGAPARPLFAGSRILNAQPVKDCHFGVVHEVNLKAVKWSMKSNHIPVIQAIGETPSGQLVSIDAADATAEISKCMQPLKVLFVNTEGGIIDEMGEVIANINLPADLDNAQKKAWCTPNIYKKIKFISELLNALPSQSSAVVTAANKLVTELFTHHGSGTLFKNTEPIHQHTELAGIQIDRLSDLMHRSFGKHLKSEYFDNIKNRFKSLYLSEGYNAAAVISNEEGIEVPYLDKFAVSMVKQGEGTGEMLWDCIRRDYKQLFWRSRVSNRINPWYFKRCEGSWSNGEWTVFWYGVSDHQVSNKIVKHALDLPSSFDEDGDWKDNTLVE